MGDAHHCSELQRPRLQNDLYCVEWDVKLYYTIPYHTILPHPNGAGPQHSPISGFPIYAYTLLRRTSTFDVLNTYGEGLVLGVCRAAPSQLGQNPQPSPILGIPVAYLR